MYRHHTCLYFSSFTFTVIVINNQKILDYYVQKYLCS